MFLVAVICCVALVQASIPIEVHRPQPYKFGYSVKDHHGEQHREEAGNGAGGVVGSYGFTDVRGIARRVNYVADHAGFRAQMFIVAVLSCVALVHASIPVEVHRPQPYKFGYSVQDHLSEQHREEAGNGAGGVVGSYGFTDARGIARRVNYVHRPQPYKFGYSVKDHHGEQHREEAGNGAGGVVGSYGFTDARGIARRVKYVADHAGFRAQVKTNEPGTANQNPAAVQVISDAPYANVAAAPIIAQPAAVVVPTVVDASPVLDARYTGLGYGAGYAGHGYRGYGLGNLGYANGGALVNTGLLGVNGGFVNIPLLGGNVRGYDSRFVNLAL
ncbi:cuticle protein 16.8 [Trichonephila inaurata madagascariensis]|uniref:Cuticle protein 16.8 n=1 Tax=Trichonephila inaurata madagascariensis TaxID=2747483 RepID=A0A8X6YSX8_9ARAC|nr:cuticle protein 16.8 [Trichonephila inaurata madagascariensis]